MEYLRNCWYMVGWADEIENAAMLTRRVCDIPLVIFRAEAGVSALVDTCPHRFAPLSRGSIAAGVVTCGYHGLAFDGTGACVRNPHGPVTRRMRVRALPTVERYLGLWTWFGDPTLADTALIPDFSFHHVGTPTAISKGMLHGNADYRLYVDNILDLSHIDFLHADTLGGGSIVGTRQQVREDERSLTVRWSNSGVPASPLQIRLGSFAPDGRFDRYTEVTWHAPGSMKLISSVGPIGASEEQLSKSIGAHVMTPETAHTLHYFFSSTRNFRIDDAEFNELFATARDKVFSTEDGPMIAAVQERMGNRDLLELQPLLLKSDEAAIKVRRKVEKMLAAERAVEVA